MSVSSHQILFQFIDELLWFEWDPIGVNDIDEARDEYSSYVDQLVGMKIHGYAVGDISDRLYYIETKRMGLIGNRATCDNIAGLIVKLDH